MFKGASYELLHFKTSPEYMSMYTIIGGFTPPDSQEPVPAVMTIVDLNEDDGEKALELAEEVRNSSFGSQSI